MQPSSPYGDWSAQNPYQVHNQHAYPDAISAPSAGRRIALGDLMAIPGCLFVFAFSFAPFVTYPNSVVNRVNSGTDVDFDGWYMAWSTQMFMAPLTWWIIVAAVAVIALAVWRVITGRDPEVLRFRLSQVQVALSLFALAVLLSYAVSHKQVAFGFDDLLTTSEKVAENDTSRPVFGWGGYLMIIGAIVTAVGAVFNHFNVGPVIGLPITAAGPPRPLADQQAQAKQQHPQTQQQHPQTQQQHPQMQQHPQTQQQYPQAQHHAQPGWAQPTQPQPHVYGHQAGHYQSGYPAPPS
jgi:hypothetical protein